MATQLDAAGLGGNLMKVNAILQSPERESFMNDIATSKAMFSGQAPELGSYMAEANQYSG